MKILLWYNEGMVGAFHNVVVYAVSVNAWASYHLEYLLIENCCILIGRAEYDVTG